MDAKKQIFKDPEGRYSIVIPSAWEYVKQEETDNKDLHQFEIRASGGFQISCIPLNDHISKMIAFYKILPHDFNLPHISFLEEFRQKPTVDIYNWMALINDQFIVASYFYNPELSESKEDGLELWIFEWHFEI